MPYGVTIKEGTGDTRIDIQCNHQSGMLYVVPAEANWVCQPENIHAHALAGFLRELVELDDPRVRELMQRWGLYYRARPIESEEEQT